jgi:HlyD family secretion protein
MVRHNVQKSGIIFALLGVISLIGCSFGKKFGESSNSSNVVANQSDLSHNNVSVAALGTLQPSGEVHLLAGPILQQGGAPRVRSILVQEGNKVRKGELIATFDNFERARTEKDRILANIDSKNSQIAVLESETKRYRLLEQNGAFSSADLESRELKLLELKSQLRELRSFLLEINTRIVDSELRSPVDGYVLKVNAQVGERPGASGVIEIGNSDNMEAVLQVDEGDIKNIKPGMPVKISSENGAFTDELQAKVKQVGVKVESRKLISSNPNSDTDQEDRVIEVRATLSPDSSIKVRNLVGVKILGRF